MSKDRLDRHKLASCICGAVIDAKPLIGYNGAKIPKNSNEALALYVGLSVIKFYMMHSFICELDLTQKTEEKTLKYLREKYNMRLPGSDEQICDEQAYQTNLINSLYWTHRHCKITNQKCFSYDTWAYSKIFYHIELYNRPYFEKFIQDYIKTLSI